MTIALISLLILGCVGSLKPSDAELKQCARDADCELAYGVYYNNSCVKGCFNSEKSAGDLVRNPCRGTRYEPFPETASCACVANRCEVRGAP